MSGELTRIKFEGGGSSFDGGDIVIWYHIGA